MPGYAGPIGGPEWTNWYLNNEPNAGWVQYLQNQGLYGFDPISRYARNQQSRVYGGYQAAASQDPNLGFYDWLNASGPDLRGEYGNVSPTDRGDFSDRTSTTRARFMRAY
jgi:hypothetical protein